MKAPTEIRRSIWIELLVIGAIIAMIVFPFRGDSYRRFATDTLRYQKGTVVEVVSEELSESPQKTGNLLGLQEVTVRLSGGEVVPIHNYLTDTHNILLNEGDSAIICVDAPKNAAPYYTVYQYDRTVGLVALTAMFFGLMLLIGGRKGFDALLSLVFSGVFLICVVLPLLYNGVSPILIGFITVLLLTLVTLLLLHGVTKECLLGIGVTLLGELAACILFGIFSGALHLTGLQLGEAEDLLLITQNTGLKIKSVLFTGMMLASLGAVMDVAVSVLAALREVSDAMPDPEPKALFGSGMRIGKNMLGTMSNTLIFAFAGGALTTMLVFFSYGVQFHQIFHSDYLALELSQGLCSTAAVILTVPAASLVGAFAFSDKKNAFTTRNATFSKRKKTGHFR